MSAGFGLRAEDADLALFEPHLKMCSFVALRRGYWRESPSIARKPHHAREARASYRRREYRDDYAEGLGRYRTGFRRKEVKCRQPGSEREKG
jgi:hypothetical protein